ncbi:MAG: hypothetical protein IT324_13010 [Anaerolineae bacterium]|nr:hypothetical protein [Anaerolineae bacterium]
MPRLIRLAMLLIAACTALIVVTHLIGRSQPNPLAVLFTNPDGTPCDQPCLLGVRPGETTLDEGVALVRQHPFVWRIGALESVSAVTSGMILQNADLIVALDKDDQNRVGRIRLYGRNGLPGVETGKAALGDALSWLGAPRTTRIIAINQPPIKYSAYFFYEQQRLYLVGRATTGLSLLRLDADGLIEAIGLSEPAWFAASFAYEQSKADAWRGFTDTHHYAIQIP